jgi:electron transport complex protein RnfG
MVSSPALLGRPDPLAVYRARQGATVTAAVVTVVAPQAYLGPVELLVAVRRDGRVLGLHVVSHRETAGLGDQIEPARSPWSLQFTDRSLAAPPAAGWAVRTDGGEFDQITGATVTSRAVVNAVRNALLLVAEREADIFGATVATGARSP